MSNLDTETIIKKILAKVEDAFNELNLPKTPYGRNELWEGKCATLTLRCGTKSNIVSY